MKNRLMLVGSALYEIGAGWRLVRLCVLYFPLKAVLFYRGKAPDAPIVRLTVAAP